MNRAAAHLARKLVPLDAGAAHLYVSKHTLRRMIARGDVTGYRVGPKLIRVDLDELDTFARPIPNGASR